MPASDAVSIPSDSYHTENSPLLPPSPIQDRLDQDAALPRLKIIVLSWATIAEGLCFWTLFPFINQMIASTGIRRERVGLYVGWIEGVYSLFAAALMFSWANVSDRYGRKRSLLISMTGSTIATACFGFSTTLPQMFFFRGLALILVDSETSA